MRTAVVTMLLALTTFAGANQSDFAAIRAILPVPVREDLAAVRFDRDVYAVTQPAFEDVRLLDEAGQPLPFIIETCQEAAVEWHDVGLPANVVSLTPDQDNQLEVILEPPQARKDKAPSSIEVVTPLRDFEKRVDVAVRRAGLWTVVVTDATIFDYSRFMDVRGCRIALPAMPPPDLVRVTFNDVTDTTTSAFVEMTTRQGGGKPDEESVRKMLHRRDFRIDSVRLVYREEQARRNVPVTELYPLHITDQHDNPDDKTTEIMLEAGYLPINALRFLVDGVNFSRQVLVEIRQSNDEGAIRWRSIGTGNLRSISFRDVREEQLTINVSETRVDALRVRIVNGDSAALRIIGVTAVCPAYQALFLARSGQACSLAYGNRSLEAPHYDDAALRQLRRDRALDIRTFTLAASPLRTEKPAPNLALRVLNSRRMLIATVLAAVAVLSWAMWRAVRGMGSLTSSGDGD